MQKKREEKRLENQRKAEEDIRNLQASGKLSKSANKSNVKKTKSAAKKRTNERPPDSESEEGEDNNNSASVHGGLAQSNNTGSAHGQLSARNSNIEEFFQVIILIQIILYILCVSLFSLSK